MQAAIVCNSKGLVARDRRPSLAFASKARTAKAASGFKVMANTRTHKVTLLLTDRLGGGEKTIEVAEDGNILDTALEAGLELSFNCREGKCGHCAGIVTAGSVSMATHCYDVLNDWHMEKGYVLICSASPDSDCTILTGEMLFFD